MNLFVTIIFAVCFGIAEFSPLVKIENCTYRLAIICAATLVAPLMAMLQTQWVASSLIQSRNSWDLQNAIIGRLSRNHSIVWAVTSLIVFAGLGWPSLVAVTWNFADVPVLYEVILLSPLMLSLVGSWVAFYDIQQLYHRPPKQWRFDWKKRWEFVSVRIRMHLFTMLMPLVLLLTLLRFFYLIDHLSVPQIILALALLSLWIGAIFPFIFTMIWETRPLSDPQLLNDLTDVCRTSGVAVTRMRVWKTGNQIANAAVTGLLPGFRIVLLTDALLKYFTPEEVTAIVRHEAGHIKLLHLPLKIFFVMLPMVALILDQTHAQGVHQWIATAIGEHGIFHFSAAQVAQVLIAILFVVYLFIVLRWLNHRLEHEADLFAAMELQRSTSHEFNDLTQSALRKLGVIAPQQLNQSTFLHPSITARIALLESARQDHSIGQKFQRSLRRRNAMILVPWMVLLLIAAFALVTN